MSVLQAQIAETLLPGMYIPEPLVLLFSWIEGRGLFTDTEEGRIGFLFPEDRLRAEWTDAERPGGTMIEFAAEGNANLHYWLGHNKAEVVNRLCVFAKTGADGSMAAFWLDEEGKQRIVHLGSGSGSTLVCVLAEEAVDFLRLIAIGYDEICCNEAFAEPPNVDGEFVVHVNEEFQKWVMSTFSVEIPRTAFEVIDSPSEIGDSESADRFCRWIEQTTA